jgi:hypothetical protein
LEPTPVASLPVKAAEPATAGVAVDFAAMAAAQRQCPDIVSMRASPTIQVIYRLVDGVHLLGDISTGVFRPFVPAAFRTAVIRSIHDMHHPGVKATTRLVSASFCWPHMGRDIAAVARSCMGERFTSTFTCNQNRSQSHSGGSHTFTLILLVRCLGRQVFLTFSRS